MELVKGDFLEVDWWTDTDFVYMNSLFEEDLLQKIGALAANMKPGSWFITSFKPLPDDGKWEVCLCKYMEMSWGQAPIHVQRKRT